MPGEHTGPVRFLRTTGQHATIEPDSFTEGGFVLSIGGAEQSHVNLADPEDIFYEYLRRIGHVVDLAAPWGEPVHALHLGAGALTLARYIQATRPGSVQYAVELERELLDFVLQELPLPDGHRPAPADRRRPGVAGRAAGGPALRRGDPRYFLRPGGAGAYCLHRVLPRGRGAADPARGAGGECGRRAGPDPGPEPGRGAARGP